VSLDVRDLAMGTPVEVRVPDTDNTWERATVSNGRTIIWHGKLWVFPAIDVRPARPRPCACGDCVTCEFFEARQRRAG